MTRIDHESPAKKPTRAEQALRLFVGSPSLRKIDVSILLGTNRGVANRAVDDLVMKGKLVLMTDGRYCLSDGDALSANAILKPRQKLSRARDIPSELLPKKEEIPSKPVVLSMDNYVVVFKSRVLQTVGVGRSAYIAAKFEATSQNVVALRAFVAKNEMDADLGSVAEMGALGAAAIRCTRRLAKRIEGCRVVKSITRD